jgi:DNA-binding response OmpR family regulator
MQEYDGGSRYSTMTQAHGGSPQILLLDDDVDYCAQLSSYLEAYGFGASTAQTHSSFQARSAEAEPDLIILDQRLGDRRRPMCCGRFARAMTRPASSSAVPPTPSSESLTWSSARMTRWASPSRHASFWPAFARCCAARGWRTRPGTYPRAEADPSGGGWMLSRERRELCRADGRTCPLTTAEFEVLRMLVDRRGEAVSRQELMLAVFRRPWKAEDRAVDTVVRKLRRKISGDHGDGGIKTVRPTGYVFVGFPNARPSDRAS